MARAKEAEAPDAEPQGVEPQDADVRLAATRAFVNIAFDDAYSIREQFSGLMERRKENRQQLRSLLGQGHLDEDQQAELEELYPERDARRRTAEERIAELEARADELRRKAAEAADSSGGE